MDGIIDSDRVKPRKARAGKHVVNTGQAAELAAAYIVHGVEHTRRGNEAAIAGGRRVRRVGPERIVVAHTMGKMPDGILASQRDMRVASWHRHTDPLT